MELQFEKEVDCEIFVVEVLKFNLLCELIKGVVCGVCVEEVEEDIMCEFCYMDKLIDELVWGKKMEKILRSLEV